MCVRVRARVLHGVALGRKAFTAPLQVCPLRLRLGTTARVVPLLSLLPRPPTTLWETVFLSHAFSVVTLDLVEVIECSFFLDF